MDKKTHPKNEKNKQNKTEKYRGFKKITQSEREMHKKKKMDGWDSAEGSVLIHQTSNVCKLPRAWQCAIDTKNLHPCWKTILQNLFGSSGETIKQFKKKKKPLRSCRDKEAATRTQQGARIRSSSWGRRRWLVPPARCQHQNLRYEGQTVGGLGEEALLYKGDLQLDSVTRLLAPTIKVLQLTQGGEIEKKMTKYAELIPVLCLTTRKHNREVSPTNCHSWQISHWLFR